MREKKGIYEKYIKRPQDFLLAILALVLLLPALLILAIVIRIKLGKPIIFKQKRPGLNERIFTLYKFRSMTDARNEQGVLLPDDVRLTDFGRKLRSSSLDELPELWNIINGTLSIVGPRPQLVRDMVFMTEEQRKRHVVRPGLTGLAQIKGRNAICWEEKLSYDLEYIDKITFRGDWKIIFQTVISVLKKEGITAEEMATAEDLGDYMLRNSKISLEDYVSAQEEAKRKLENIDE